MQKLRNLVLIATVIVIISGPGILYGVQHIAKFELPNWLTNSEAQQLSGSKNNPNVRKNLSIDGFANRKLQTSIETEVGNYIPAKSRAILINASLQRKLIAIANTLYRFGAQPTFFGSEWVQDCADGRLYPLPVDKNKKSVTTINEFVNRLNTVAENRSSCRFSYYLCEYSGASLANPAACLVKNPLTHTEIIDLTTDKLSPNIVFGTDSSTALEFKNQHFRTDFHWNMEGSYCGYVAIASMLSIHNPVTRGNEYACDYPPYQGSLARSGLYLDSYADSVYDYFFDLPSYSVSIGGTKGDYELLASLSPENWNHFHFNPDMLTERYTELFPNRPGGVTEIVNTSLGQGKTLLILGDSYARPIDRLLAANYSTTILFNPSECKNKTISEMIGKYHPDDVLVLLSTYSLFSHDEYVKALS